jgi:gas vesicle structural protein
MAIQQASITRGGSVTRAPRPSNLAEVLDLILDKGLVIDAYVRVSLIGIELLTVDLRVVVASVDTYLRFAEAVNRLDLEQVANNLTLEDLQKKGARGKGREEGEKALEKVKDRVKPGGDDDDQRGGQDSDDDEDDDSKGGLRGAVKKVAERAKRS